MIALLVVVGAVVAMVVWALQRGRERRVELSQGTVVDLTGATVQPQGTVVDLTAATVLAVGQERGPGVLRLTGTQLIFAAASGRVLVLERLDITGATLTRELPDRTVAAPLLAVSTPDEVYYFELDRPDLWLRRITSDPGA